MASYHAAKTTDRLDMTCDWMGYDVCTVNRSKAGMVRQKKKLVESSRRHL